MVATLSLTLGSQAACRRLYWMSSAFPAAIRRALVADALARSCISHSDQVLSRYPVLKIHHTATRQRIRKAVVMQRLTPTLTSELP